MGEGFADTFAGAAGGSEPFHYQERTAAHLLGGADVLLTAPTGSGKTLAAIAPFLHARRVGIGLADRVVYALPLRALARRLAEDLRAVLSGVEITVQTGDQPDDDLFTRGDIIFTTIDQLLSAYLHVPLSLPRKLDNVNAGALVGGLIVFDEVHLLEPERALGTAVQLMGDLRGLARFVVATATLTSQARAELKERCHLVEERPSDEELSKMPALSHRQRSWTRGSGQLDAREVRDRHRGTRTLVVVNTVRRAQEIGAALLSSPPPGAEVIVLHSRYYAGDRRNHEDAVAARLGKQEQTGGSPNVVVVSTQVVEAGLDFSADLLLTELAPANALIQRAGRCARYAPPRHRGSVVIYDTCSDDGKRDLGPYVDLETVVARTWDNLPHEEADLGATGEAQLLEAALGEHEAEVFSRLLFREQAARARGDSIRRVWACGDLSAVRELIRDASSVSVFPTSAPERLSMAHGPIPLSVPTRSWRGFLTGVPLSRVLGIDEADDVDLRDSAWRSGSWTPLQGVNDARLAYAVPPDLARYTAKLGLELGRPSDEEPPDPPYRDRPAGTRPHYRCEKYGDHVRRVLHAARQLLGRCAVARHRLAERYGLTLSAIDALVLLAAGLHDVGKLDVQCQRAAAEWQHRKGMAGDDHNAPLAHTDYDPQIDGRAPSPFGRHAVEGALACMDLIGDWLLQEGVDEEAVPDLTRVVASAIARHHVPRAKDGRPFVLIEGALDHVVAPFRSFLPPAPHAAALLTADSGRDAGHYLLDVAVEPSDCHLWPLYTFVVRALRLSDQAGTAEGARVGAGT